MRSLNDLGIALLDHRERAAQSQCLAEIAFDACSMGSIEVAYDLVPYADYMMASEMWVPDDGLNYSSLQGIVDDPYITPAELCSRFLVDYAAYYCSLEGTPKQYMLDESFAMSVIDLRCVGPVVEGMGQLSSELIERLYTWRQEISDARNLTEDYNGSLFYDAVDIRHMCEVMQSELPSDPDVGGVLADIVSAFDACIVDHVWGTNPENCQLPVSNTHGLAANYPAFGVICKPYLVGKYRPDWKAPNVSGLYFASETFKSRGIGVDRAARAALTCVEHYLGRRLAGGIVWRPDVWARASR